ncbi:uncharacterized protein LOC111054138 isoform X2 [Nilaparvata lugens]|uniref:uncharacterized protein LOC111054138 isoform X2 n=1 Tax=Nilaparvata lugens TaxID=108931 RepID=UPI00193CA38E|nr:uncharacterized protein LOC111054138 isoform X2 [Nilaparvata lugens]
MEALGFIPRKRFTCWKHLELILYEVPLSIERAYSTLINDKTGCNFDEYRVYSHLLRNGYRLFRHSSSVSVTRYEKNMQLQQHSLTDKSLYTADCDNNKSIVEKEAASVVNKEPVSSSNVSMDSVVEYESLSGTVENSNIACKKLVSSVSDNQPADKSSSETGNVVDLELDEPELSVVETEPTPQVAGNDYDKNEVIELSSSEDEESNSSENESNNKHKASGNDKGEEEEDSDNDSVVEVPIKGREIIYAEISSDEECVNETEDRNRISEKVIEEIVNEEEEQNEDENDEDESESNDEDNSDSNDSDGANWKRRSQQPSSAKGSSQVDASPRGSSRVNISLAGSSLENASPANSSLVNSSLSESSQVNTSLAVPSQVNASVASQSSSISTVPQQNPIPVRTSFVTVNEFLFPRPDRPKYRVVIDTGNNALNEEMNRFYEEIEVIDLDSDKEDESAPVVEVRSRNYIMDKFFVLRGNSIKFIEPKKYLPVGAKPSRSNYSIHYTLNNRPVIISENIHQPNRQNSMSQINIHRESRMRLAENVIVRKSNPSHQQLLNMNTPSNRFQPMNAPYNPMNTHQQMNAHMTPMGAPPAPFINHPVMDEFNNFANSINQMMTCIVDGTVKNQFEKQLQNAFRSQPIHFQRQILDVFRKHNIEFQQQVNQAFNNQAIQFQNQMQQNLNNQPTSLLGAPPFPPLMANNANFPVHNNFPGVHVKNEYNYQHNSGFGGSSIPQNTFLPLMHNNANFPAQINFPSVHVKNESYNNSSNVPIPITPQQNANQNFTPAETSSNSCPFSNPQDLLKNLMGIRGNKGKVNKKRRQFMKRLKQFISVAKGDSNCVDLNPVTVKSENLNNKAKNDKITKQQIINLLGDDLSSHIIFDTTGGDPAVFVEDIPLVTSPPKAKTPNRATRRKRKQVLLNKQKNMVSKRIKPDPESAGEVTIISDSGQERNAPSLRQKRGRYFGLRNGSLMRQMSTFGDNDVAHADVTPTIKSEIDAVIVDDDAVCKTEPVEEVDRKPQIESMEIVEPESEVAMIDVKQELVDANMADQVDDQTRRDPNSCDDSDDADSNAVEETCDEVSAGDCVESVDCWAQLKEKSPARVLFEVDSSSEENTGEIAPLLKPSDCQSLESVLKALQVVGTASFATDSIERLKIAFDVYLPSTCFKKSARGLPNYRLVIRR